MWPHGGIIVEQPRGRDERHHLEEGATEGMFQTIAVACDEQIHNPYRGNEDDANVHLEF